MKNSSFKIATVVCLGIVMLIGSGPSWAAKPKLKRARVCAPKVAALVEPENLGESEKIIALPLSILALWYSEGIEAVAEHIGVSRPEVKAQLKYDEVISNTVVLEDYFFPFLTGLKKSENAEIRTKYANWLMRVQKRYATQDLSVQNLQMAMSAEKLDLEFLQTTSATSEIVKIPLEYAENGIPSKIEISQKSKEPDESDAPWDDGFDSDKTKVLVEEAEGRVVDAIKQYSRTSSGNQVALLAAAKELMIAQTELANLIIDSLEQVEGDESMRKFVIGILTARGIYDQRMAQMLLSMPSPLAKVGEKMPFGKVRMEWKKSFEEIFDILKDAEHPAASGFED